MSFLKCNKLSFAKSSYACKHAHTKLNRCALTDISLLAFGPGIYITEHLAGAQTVLLHRKLLLLLLLLLFSCHCPHVLFACQVLERCRLQKRLSSGPAAPDSAVEHSTESDAAPQAGAGPEGEEEEDNDSAASHGAGNQTPVKEQDLQAQVHTHTHNTNGFMPKRFVP